MLRDSEAGVKVWKRDPLKQTVARDLIAMEVTYARACTVSREYAIVKVPIVEYWADNDSIEIDTSKCTEDEIRFIRDNVTRLEHYAATGGNLPKVDRSR